MYERKCMRASKNIQKQPVEEETGKQKSIRFIGYLW